MRGPDECPKCGERLAKVDGCTVGDVDGIRCNRWCEDCKIMFTTHAHGYEPRLVLRDVYEGEAKARLAQALRAALVEVEK